MSVRVAGSSSPQSRLNASAVRTFLAIGEWVSAVLARLSRTGEDAPVAPSLALLEKARRPVIIVGHGARFDMPAVLELAETLLQRRHIGFKFGTIRIDGKVEENMIALLK